MCHTNRDIATAGDRTNLNVGSTALINHASTVKDTILADTHIGTRFGANGEEVYADRQGRHVADGVFSRLNAERQNGTVT